MHLESSLHEPCDCENLSISSLRAISSEPDFENCQKPFTEHVRDVKKGNRVTDRYRRYVFWACDNFGDLSSVRKEARCSASFLYKTYYAHLEHQARCNRRASWPKIIGVDEHSFKRNKTYGHTEFATVFVDYNKRRLVEVVEGKQAGILKSALEEIPHPERVKHVRAFCKINKVA